LTSEYGVGTMPQIRSMIAACALLVSLGSAQATTFSVSGTSYFSGTFSGTLTINVNAGWVTGVRIIYPGIAHFTKVLEQSPFLGGWGIVVGNTSLTATLSLIFSTAPNPRTLVGFSGGEIYSGEVKICMQGQPDLCRRAAVVLRGTIGSPGITRFGPGVPTQVSFPSPPGTTAFGPRTPTEAFGPCYSQFAPVCGPLRRPYCSRTIPCSYFGQIGSICAEWQCVVPAEIQRRRGARRG
jgi:hypothetical protein